MALTVNGRVVIALEDHVTVDLIQNERSAILLGQRNARGTEQRVATSGKPSERNPCCRKAYSFLISSFNHTRPVGLLGLVMRMPSTPSFNAFSIAARVPQLRGGFMAEREGRTIKVRRPVWVGGDALGQLLEDLLDLTSVVGVVGLDHGHARFAALPQHHEGCYDAPRHSLQLSEWRTSGHDDRSRGQGVGVVPSSGEEGALRHLGAVVILKKPSYGLQVVRLSHARSVLVDSRAGRLVKEHMVCHHLAQDSRRGQLDHALGHRVDALTLAIVKDIPHRTQMRQILSHGARSRTRIFLLLLPNVRHNKK